MTVSKYVFMHVYFSVEFQLTYIHSITLFNHISQLLLTQNSPSPFNNKNKQLQYNSILFLIYIFV